LAASKGNTKKASIPVTFSRLSWQSKSLQKSERYKINGKHFHPKNL